MRVRTQFSTSAFIQMLAAVTAILLGQAAHAQGQVEIDESLPVAGPHHLVANTRADGLHPGAAFAQGPAFTSSAEAVLASCSSPVLPTDGATSGNGRAPNPRFRGGRAVYLITAGELAAAGFPIGATVTGIGWHYSTAPGVVASGTLRVFLENTADTTNLKGTGFATATSTMTLVHDAATTLPNVTTPFDIPLSLGGIFSYGGGGIYVAFDWRYPVGALSATASVACNIALVNGIASSQTTGVPPAADTLGAGNFRPETRLTAAAANNDASVDYVIALGALPRDLVGPQVFQAVVTNRSGVALTNLPVTLDISGANTFSDTQTVPALAACGGQTVVTFAAAPVGVLGADVVTASVPPDELNANNSKSRPLDITVERYSYKHPGTIASGGVGFNGGTGALVAKFTTTVATSVTAATLEFLAASFTTYRVAIYADSGGGTPGAELYLDAADRTVAAAGPVTIALPSVVPVSAGDFFVGVHQTNSTFPSYSYDAETPIRPGTFFFATPLPVTAWGDFSPGTNFKLNIGVILDPCPGGPAASCDDGNVCTTNDTCQAGVCVGGPPLNCDDANVCTADICNPATGCAHTNIGGSCDDNIACTVNDSCSGVVCVGTSTGPPSEVDGVRLTKSGGSTEITWNPASGSTASDVVRGQLSGLPVGPGGGDEICLEDNLGGALAADAVNPAPGGGFWYLVRASSFCGDGPYGFEGLHGLPSTARVTTTCVAFCGGGGACDDFNACTADSCNVATGLCEHTIDATDSDGDRLANCVETNTGVYVSPTNTGTNPNNADTDGDAIRDGDEVLGTLAGLDLPAMGASPLKKNILLEYDWFDDNNDPGICGAHTHRPAQAMLDRTSAAFAAAPNVNPDGTTGITLIHDYGQGGVFTGGNFVADANGVVDGGVNDPEFQAIKVPNFAANRDGYFHYTLLPHRYGTTSDSSGQAELPGDDLIVSLQCYSGTINTSNTIMHELGHNLFLRHGGNTNCNWMPNYNSVMNYRYQFPGIDSDASCNASGSSGEANTLSYSVGTRLSLNESALNEFVGVCGTPGIDWNGTGTLENPVTYDLNREGTSPFSPPDPNQSFICGATISTLNDYNDWANLVFTGLTDGDRAHPKHTSLIDCDNPTLPRIVAPEWRP